ncbi:MAG: hypothetical protein VX466_03295 [Myxococcota bacterium]|nr:hypothetical protein [Myxococcota bacterium]
MWLQKGCHAGPARGYFQNMVKISRKAADTVVLTAKLYCELALSVLSLLPSRRSADEL